MEFALPPKIERQVGIEMREDDIREQIGEGTRERKGELFRTNLFAARAADVAMGVDPRLDFLSLGRRIGRNYDRTTGVVLGHS